MRFQTLKQIQKQLINKKISATELTQLTLKNSAENAHNALISCCDALALKQAKQADEAFSNGKCLPLQGIPVIYKDNFNIKGSLTTCASKMLANHHSVYDATVVSLMQQQGAISLAKANMDEFAMGSTNENSAYGAVTNPFNTLHCTGGSSGGSAAAVASGLVPVAFGSDTGGSVRQPAAYCGLVGLKPTYGRLSRYGVVAFASSFDQPGILAHTAEDTAMVLTATAHHDPNDSTSVKRPNEDYLTQLTQPLNGKKVGLVRGLFERITDKATQKRLSDALATYEKMGVNFIDIELPDPALCVAAYYVLSSSECASNLSRFDGVRYGYRSPNSEDLNALYTNSRTQSLGPEVKRRILLGTFALSAGYYDAYYVKAQKMRRAVLNQFNARFEQVDYIMLPTSLTTAPRLGQDFDYHDDMCTITANLAGLPALSHTVGLANGLPVGLQIIGKHFAEGGLLNITHQFQQQTDFHHLHPDA